MLGCALSQLFGWHVGSSWALPVWCLMLSILSGSSDLFVLQRQLSASDIASPSVPAGLGGKFTYSVMLLASNRFVTHE